MKIFCIGRNYADHAKELNNPIPEKPLVFMKPTTALLIKNRHFFYPELSNDIHYEGEVVLKIGKNGRHVQPEFALSYIEGIGFGLDFTARDLQQNCKEKGLPWEIAKGFDHSAPISEFVLFKGMDPHNINIVTKLNGDVVQDGNTKDLLFSFEDIIVYLSKYFTLQMGDYIFTGTPAGVGPIKVGDRLEGYINGKKMLKCDVM
ncbi:MAG: acylpyruvate hydrolase [Saprospiraceae bacterium]|jgi:2-keto-4-pentenoate hydratase/2-oxohepta-3-ene-1,7-dioic acid hydratase in catechol pathway